MSKPTLSQIIEIARTQNSFVEIIKDNKLHFVLCEDTVKRFGDVEIKDLGVSMYQVSTFDCVDEHKTRFKIFI